MDKKRIEAAVTEILLAVGENPDREGLKETPKRPPRRPGQAFENISRAGTAQRAGNRERYSSVFGM